MLRNSQETREAPAASHAYQDFLDVVKKNPKVEATKLIRAMLEDTETCKSILDDTTFDLDEFKHTLARETHLRGHIIGMFEFAFDLKNIIAQSKPSLLVDMASEIHERLLAGQVDPSMAAYNRQQARQNNFDKPTAALCHLIVDEKIMSLNGNAESEQELQLLTRLNQIIDLAVNYVIDASDSQEYGKEKESVIKKSVESYPPPTSFNHVDYQLRRAEEISRAEQEERDVQKAILLSLEEADQPKEPDQGQDSTKKRDKGKEKEKTRDGYDATPSMPAFYGDAEGELELALKLSMETYLQSIVPVEDAEVDTDEASKVIEEVEEISVETKVTESEKPVTDEKPQEVKTEKTPSAADIKQQEIKDYYEKMEAIARAKEQNSAAYSPAFFSQAPTSGEEPIQASILDNSPSDDFNYYDASESDDEVGSDVEDYSSDQETSNDEINQASPRLGR